jgi:hypothetical protein
MNILETHIPSQPELVDIRLDLSDRNDACLVTFAGRIVIEQHDPDAPPLLGPGVELVGDLTLEQLFTGKRRRGSCPVLGANKANVVLRGVPRADALAAGWTGGVLRPLMTVGWEAAVDTKHAPVTAA